MIYATLFNYKTKQAVSASNPTGMLTLDAAERMFPGTPIERTRNTLIYTDRGDIRLCLSWIRFHYEETT